MSAQYIPEIEALPGWVLAYSVIVLAVSFLIAWRLDRRDNAAEDAEKLRRHVNRTDTYLDPAGWQQ